jgi:hypothetical protein
MSLSVRHRVGLLLSGAVIAAPLLAAGGADAASPTITFTGQPLLGISTLACPSTPSQSKITVTAGTIVDFVNRTGRQATLWAGDSQKDLPDKSLVPVMFTSGPASVVVQMLPDCSLDLGKHISMTVTVLAPGSAPSTPPPAGGSGGAPTGGTDKNGNPTPRSGATTARSQITPTATPSTTAPAATHTTTSNSSGDNNPFAAAPTSTDPAKSAVIGTVAGPRQPRSASGLLTLIATVGVVGVAAAAIRAILAQRANRALAV